MSARRVVVLRSGQSPEFVTHARAVRMVADGDASWIGAARRKVRLIPFYVVTGGGQPEYISRKKLAKYLLLGIAEHVMGRLFILKEGRASSCKSVQSVSHSKRDVQQDRARLNRRRSLRHDGRQLGWHQTDQHLSSEIRASVLAENVADVMCADKRASAGEARNSE